MEPNNEGSGTSMGFFTYLIIVILILAIGVGGTLFITKPGTAKKEMEKLEKARLTADSTAKAERRMAQTNDDLLTTAQADLTNCESDNSELNDSINNLTIAIAEMDTTLAETQAALAAATTKPGKKAKVIKTPPAVVSDSTTLANKVPTGIQKKDKGR